MPPADRLRPKETMTTPAHGHRADPYTLVHRPHSTLPEGFPLPRISPRSPAEYQHIGPEGWNGNWPPEDSAIPPDAEWTEAQRMLVLAAYQQKWGRFLEANQTYDTTWPPEAGLWTEGSVFVFDVCTVHGDVECDECLKFKEVVSEVEPAEWHWTVTIETYEWEGNSGYLADSEQFHFLTTRMDPREVDYQW